MPRPLRIEYAGALYHVSNRGAKSQPIFRSPGDGEDFLRGLADVAAARRWRCHAYCLMTDRYRLVLRTDRPNLSDGMQALGAGYTTAFNRRHGRDGQVFAGRFKATLVEPEPYLTGLVRFVTLAPVLAGLAADPAAWRWTSYRATAGLIEAPSFLDLGWLIGRFGSTMARAREAWRADIAAAAKHTSYLAAWEKVLQRRSVLGSPKFVGRHQARITVSPLDPLLRALSP